MYCLVSYLEFYDHRNLQGSPNVGFVFWTGTCLMLTLVLALIVIVLSYQRYFFQMKRQESELMLKTSLESEIQERQRIASDLHDSVLGDLNAIKMYLAILKRETGTIDVYGELESGVEQAIENTRLIANKLMPPLLESLGLEVAVSDYFEKLSLQTKITFTLISTETFGFSVPTQYELYRILQEFTTNMIKYGKPTYCEVLFYRSEEMILIDITDDGQAFIFDHFLKASKGYGLKNILSRLKIIGGTLQQKDAATGNHFLITIKSQLC